MLGRLLFSDTIGRIVHTTRSAWSYTTRLLKLLLLNLGKKVKVSSLTINEKFLLTNGLLVIRWESRRFFYAKINKKIRTYNKQGIALVYDKIDSPLQIEIHGLFNKLSWQIELPRTHSIVSKELEAPLVHKKDFTSYLHNKIIRKEKGEIKISTKQITGVHPAIQSFTITIPSPKL